MVLVALAMVAIIAMAALSIDVITLYLAKEEAQRAADTAALAGARIISVSGLTGDPANAYASWSAICGGTSSPATQAATAVALQNVVGGAAANTVTVTYSAAGTSNQDCSALPTTGPFGVNPMVTVQITRSALPNFFSRIWGNAGNTISASATAEAFNPSLSGSLGNQSTGTIIPVQPRCVKPWIVPNHDPLRPPKNGAVYCDQGSPPGSCNSFVNTTDGSITSKGISLGGGATGGVIGEQFWLVADCAYAGSTCTPFDTSPARANHAATAQIPDPPNLEYLPGQVLSSAIAVPSCGTESIYQKAVAGCDQSTVYQCGVPSSSSANPNLVDLSENPATSGDTTEGVMCLIHEGDAADTQPDGQDSLSPYAEPSSYPFQILAGSSNPMVLKSGLAKDTPITASSSIVSLPIYDDSTAIGSGTTPVTIVGFLQVFINAVDAYGNVNVTILNVVGCSNGAGGTYPVGANPVTGTSPVPSRLITAP